MVCSLSQHTLERIVAEELAKEKKLASYLEGSLSPGILDEYVRIHQRLIYFQRLLKPRLEEPNADTD